jgi:hypothetical protein
LNDLPGTSIRHEDGQTILEFSSGMEIRLPERLAPRFHHGTRHGYNNQGCRCADCVAANSEYMRARRKRAKATA